MSMQHLYILEGKTLKPVNDVLEWAKWYETADRVVSKTELPGDVCVSTVFLGMDSGIFNDKPLLFETMIFGGEHDGFQERYSTWEEAEAGHKKAIELIFTV